MKQSAHCFYLSQLKIKGPDPIRSKQIDPVEDAKE